MNSYEIQKKKDFFEIREQLKEVEKYIDEVNINNRFLELDFWMDDLFVLATKYYEGLLAQVINHYKNFCSKDRAESACYFLKLVFEKEGWELGILEKYGTIEK